MLWELREGETSTDASRPRARDYDRVKFRGTTSLEEISSGDGS